MFCLDLVYYLYLILMSMRLLNTFYRDSFSIWRNESSELLSSFLRTLSSISDNFKLVIISEPPWKPPKSSSLGRNSHTSVPEHGAVSGYEKRENVPLLSELTQEDWGGGRFWPAWNLNWKVLDVCSDCSASRRGQAEGESGSVYINWKGLPS